MQFRTAIDIASCGLPPLCHCGRVLLLGSCFSDNVGERLRRAMVDAVVNPFGTTYNPLSLARCAGWLAEGRRVAADELFHHQGLWHHFMFHSRFSAASAASAASAMNASLDRGAEQLRHCTHLFVTLGTAMAYRLAQGEGQVVNNCHKLPAARFVRQMCTLDEITAALEQIASQVQQINPGAHVIFTVSPIRHIADGLATNHLSKSLLTVAVHSIIAHRPGQCHYFPAFEILNDDLRDYRFYGPDMAHPSEVAIDYVWELFKEAFFTPAERQKAEQCERLSRQLAHRPANPATAEATRERARQALAQMAARYPYIERLQITV